MDEASASFVKFAIPLNTQTVVERRRQPLFGKTTNIQQTPCVLIINTPINAKPALLNKQETPLAHPKCQLLMLHCYSGNPFVTRKTLFFQYKQAIIISFLLALHSRIAEVVYF